MARRTTSSRLGFLAIGIALVAMALSMTPAAGSPLAKGVLLGSGILLLSASLILLQLRFFREGDRRKATMTARSTVSHASSAPQELKNPKQRVIWSGMEETRMLMQQKEEDTRSEARRSEKRRLGLSEEEEILYMGQRSWLSFWPVALLSLMLIAASTFSSGAASLILIVSGLSGLLVLSAAGRSSRYYITNFRVLVYRRPLPGVRPRWSVIHFSDIHGCRVKRIFPCTSLGFEGLEGTVRMSGLSRIGFETVTRILRERIPRNLCTFI